MAPTPTSRRRYALAMAAGLILALAACGGDGSSEAGATPDVSLSEQERSQLDERLIELANAQTAQSGSVSGGGYGYSPADGFVTGYPSDWQTALERCQALADAVGELDGPAGDVPIKIVSPRNDGTGEFDVVASGTGGGTCEET